LLSPSVVEQAKRLGAAIRQQRVAALVGSGISCQVGLPRWNELVRRLILAWKRWDRSNATHLSAENYVRLFHDTFGNDLAIVSYLQLVAAEADGPEFGELLYSALYSTTGEQLILEPSHIHRHLIALFQHVPRRIWTTNYDDLLEEAAALNGQLARSLHPTNRQANGDFLVTHLHGYLPQARSAGTIDPARAKVVLAEDDYHALTMDIAGWTNREYYRLFDDHQVLILGMSLDDPNLRRVLATLPPDDAETPNHFALLRAPTPSDLSLTRIQEKRRLSCATIASCFRTRYWKQHRVEIISLNDHAEILPFLVRLRYESYGERPGSLWATGSKIGYETINPQNQQRKQFGNNFLRLMAEHLVSDFSLEPSELVEIGVFLLKSDSNRLELAFRSGSAGHREFSADPDHPTGLAGRVFVSGDMVRVRRDDPLHDYGLADSIEGEGERYEGIISVPLIDWKRGGIPVGVAYVTVSTTEGKLFRLPNQRDIPEQKTLSDLYNWMSELWPILFTTLEDAIE
jgi:hypothetical protein